MAFDIYGNPLRRGYCEVHPNVHQEYPCDQCLMESRHKQNKSKYHYTHKELELLADNILSKHEDKNEYHFHDVDRKWIIEAMIEFKNK